MNNIPGDHIGGSRLGAEIVVMGVEGLRPFYSRYFVYQVQGI